MLKFHKASLSQNIRWSFTVKSLFYYRRIILQLTKGVVGDYNFARVASQTNKLTPFSLMLVIHSKWSNIHSVSLSLYDCFTSITCNLCEFHKSRIILGESSFSSPGQATEKNFFFHCRLKRQRKKLMAGRMTLWYLRQ